MSLEHLVRVAEHSASRELFGLPGRPDENGDRTRLRQPEVCGSTWCATSPAPWWPTRACRPLWWKAKLLESIHNHSAFARIRHRR